MTRSLSVCLLAASMLRVPVLSAGEKWSHEIPAEAKTILERAEKFVLLSLDPREPEKTPKHRKLPKRGKMPQESFHGTKVVGRTSVDEGEVRRELVTAFVKGVEEAKGGPSMCFIPRHGIRVVSRGRVVDFVICFQCHQALAYVGGGKEQPFLVSESPAPMFNKALEKAGVPLPPR